MDLLEVLSSPSHSQAEPLATPETESETPIKSLQNPSEAHALWTALRFPLQTFSAPTPMVTESVAYKYDDLAATTLGRAYEDWTVSVERFHGTVYRIPPERRTLHFGRASSRSPCLRNVRPRASATPQLANPTARWWRTLVTNL